MLDGTFTDFFLVFRKKGLQRLPSNSALLRLGRRRSSRSRSSGVNSAAPDHWKPHQTPQYGEPSLCRNFHFPSTISALRSSSG